MPGCWCHKESMLWSVGYCIFSQYLCLPAPLRTQTLCSDTSFLHQQPPPPSWIRELHQFRSARSWYPLYTSLFSKNTRSSRTDSFHGKSITLLLLAGACVFLWLAGPVAFPAAWVTGDPVEFLLTGLSKSCLTQVNRTWLYKHTGAFSDISKLSHPARKSPHMTVSGQSFPGPAQCFAARRQSCRQTLCSRFTFCSRSQLQRLQVKFHCRAFLLAI